MIFSTLTMYGANGSSRPGCTGASQFERRTAAAALEVMSRFAANPKWLTYLPPTMSPSETTKRDGLLEHPAEAFSYYRASGVPTVVVELKHMGSRAILIVCESKDVARARFGILEDKEGGCYTRTGRRFSRTQPRNASSLQPFRCSGAEWILESIQDELGVPRLRADALVGEGTRAGAPAICVGWNSSAGRLGEGCRRAPARSGARRRCRGVAGSPQGPARPCRAVRSGLSALLLAGRIASRYPHRPVFT
jgi:hypothetical protein